MSQTTTAEKPDTRHVSILAQILEGVAGVDLSAFAPEEPHKCSHYVEVGTVMNDSTRRMVALRIALIDDYNKKVKVLNDEGQTRESVDDETARFLAETSVKIETLGSLINYQIELEFPTLKKVGVPLYFGPNWVLSYTDHSLESFFGDMFGGGGSDDDLPQGLRGLFSALGGGMTIVVKHGGHGSSKDRPPVQ